MSLDIIKLEAAVKNPSGKKISILAYSGGVITVPNWGPVVIDLRGLDASKPVKILADHQNSLSAIAGQGIASIRDGKLYIEGAISEKSQAGQTIIELSRDGISFEASVGVEPAKTERVRAGETLNINGQRITPTTNVTVIKSGRLREVSIVPCGCDAETSVRIAAALNTKQRKVGADFMDTETIREIYKTADRFRNVIPAERLHFIERQAIEAGWDSSKLTEHCLEAMESEQKLNSLLSTRQTAPQFRGDNDHPAAANPKATLAAAALLMLGHRATAEKHYDERTLQAADDLRCTSALSLCEKSLILAGQAVPTDKTEMINASFSSHTLDVALSDLASKVMKEAFDLGPQTWRTVGKTVPVRNFHRHKTVSAISKDSLYKQVGDGGELKHIQVGEEVLDHGADTHGCLLVLTRKDIINDDLNVYTDLQRSVALNAARTVNARFWETLLDADESFWTSANYATGAGTVLSIDALADAIRRLRNAKDADGNPIWAEPKCLVVPPALESTALRLVNSQEIRSNEETTYATSNPWHNRLEVVVEPLLGSEFLGDDRTWYLTADKEILPAMLVSFLGGNESPTVEPAQLPAERLGVGIRAYLDFGCDLGDPRGITKYLGHAE